MASWLRHPRYIPIRDGLITHLQRTRYRFRRLDPVVFLCGADKSKSRDALRDYLKKHLPDLDVFYAERVWESIAKLGERDALQMEADLAELADVVIVIVESAGTIAELGAFSLSEPLRKKLLPIVDEKHRHESSFLATGPLRWIDNESDYKPTIYTSLKFITTAADQIEERIRRIPVSRSVKVSDLAASPKHLLFFICDLIAVIYPATIPMIIYYLTRISPSLASSTINIPTLVGLGVAMDLLRRHDVTTSAGGASKTYFAPKNPAGASRPFHHSRLLYLEGQRAVHASVLLTIPEARAALDQIRKAA
jgi:hypothetical protein